MNIYPSVKVVAKRQSELTHRVRKQTLVNFDRYVSSNYLEQLDGYYSSAIKELEHSKIDSPFLEEAVREGSSFSKKMLDISDKNISRVWGHMRFITFDIFFSKQHDSEVKGFPYEVIEITFNYNHGKDDQETYNKLSIAVCDPLPFLLNYKDLGLTSRQKDALIIVPYWGDFSSDRDTGIKYKEFSKMGDEELKTLLLGAFEKVTSKERREWIKNLEDFLSF